MDNLAHVVFCFNIFKYKSLQIDRPAVQKPKDVIKMREKPIVAALF